MLGSFFCRKPTEIMQIQRNGFKTSLLAAFVAIKSRYGCKILFFDMSCLLSRYILSGFNTFLLMLVGCVRIYIHCWGANWGFEPLTEVSSCYVKSVFASLFPIFCLAVFVIRALSERKNMRVSRFSFRNYVSLVYKHNGGWVICKDLLPQIK